LTARYAGGQSFRILQRFALKLEPRIILKALRSSAFKIILVVRLIGNCCKFAYA
jgi:hypothetical protein